jgi:hypothetical protein
MSTDIANKWQALLNKEDIVSSQHDGRIYYLVYNPEGDTLEHDCMGNEIWVLDVGTDKPTWSRWKVQGISLKKVQIGDKLYMAVVRPDAIFILDYYSYMDEYAAGAGTQLQPIPWKLETNTLGANRQHDALALLYKAQVHVGDSLGAFKWGVRGQDANGMMVDVNKITRMKQSNTGVDLTSGHLSGFNDLGDMNDDMGVQRDMMEWRFYAESIPGEMSYGQIDFVQFLITQLTTNYGYEEGSIQTFQYQRNAAIGNDNVTANGVTMPMDTSRP